MSRDWIRAFRLMVSGSSGAIDLSEMRCRFVIKQWTIQAPNLAEITVSNLSEQTSNRIVNGEFDKVELAAGYRDNAAVLFKGNIRQKYAGRENPTDTYLFLNCADGDQGYNFAIVNKTLAAGSTPKDQVDVAMQALKEFGVTLGFVTPDLSTPKYPRAVVLYGMARDVLRTIALSKGATWSIQNGEVQIVEKDKTLKNSEIVLNSTSGLIGMPTQTLGGIMARSLINPQIKVHSVVRIDQKSVQRAAFNLGLGGFPDTPENMKYPSIAADGRYKVLQIETIGDTRGQPWYMDLACIAASGDGFVPQNLIQYLGTE